MIIRHAKESDMKSVYSMELAAFPPAGAASPDAYPYRLKHFPECFFIAEAEGFCPDCGHLNRKFDLSCISCGREFS